MIASMDALDAADLRIRAAHWSDAPALGPLLEQLSRSLTTAGSGDGALSAAIGADGSRNLLVERARCAIVAFGVVEGVGAARALVAVAVADDHRRHGLAGVLVERLAAAAWAEGTRRVVVHAPVAAADLRALLRRRCARH
jgi:GNAT superfamily N-acetyltransferase